ncbi:MAG: DNA methyltransferase [Pseudomonadota bacterium]|nr:DNA methyltransferase [Pseudomonadota bacterium]
MAKIEQVTTKIQYIPTENLIPYQNNAKKHPEKQVQQIAASIQQFGFINPIIVNSSKEIIAGHGRLEGAKVLKLKQVPVILVDHLTEAQVKAYRLADNQLTMNSGYDTELLRVELADLSSLDLDFDLDITGFELPEIEFLLEGETSKDVDVDDEVIEDDVPKRASFGDVWQLGEHKLICGDSTKVETYQNLMGEELADVILTDPPYNVKIRGHVCGNGKVQHEEFAMASGEMTDAEFVAFLEAFIKHNIAFSHDGSLHYIFMDWRHIYDLLHAGQKHYTELKNICVWNKDNGGMGTMYRSKHELVALFKNGKDPHINNVQLGVFGRYRTNVWDYAGVNSFGKNQSDLKMHPTVKPVSLLIDALRDSTHKGGIVLDSFGGSGSTLIACEKSGRKARLIEYSLHYCDVILHRWEALTGETPVKIYSEDKEV